MLLPPLFCRSWSRFVRNDCKAAVPEGFAAVAAGVAAAVEAGVAEGVLPPSALTNWVNALLSVEIVFEDRVEPVVLVTI